VLDAFHVVRLGLKAMEETRRRVQQQQLGHRGRKPDPLYRIRNALRAGENDKLIWPHCAGLIWPHTLLGVG
jgi:transposase